MKVGQSDQTQALPHSDRSSPLVQLTLPHKGRIGADNRDEQLGKMIY